MLTTPLMPRHLFMPGRVVCFEKRREYFLAVQSCCARKPCPNFPVWALARLRKFTGLSRFWLAPVGSTPASLPARLSNQTTRPFNQSFTCLDDVVMTTPPSFAASDEVVRKLFGCS